LLRQNIMKKALFFLSRQTNVVPILRPPFPTPLVVELPWRKTTKPYFLLPKTLRAILDIRISSYGRI